MTNGDTIGRKATMMTLLALASAGFLMAAAVPAQAASACAAVSCTQTETDTTTGGTQTQSQVCAGNIQIGVSVTGDVEQCEQTAYQCGANAEGDHDCDDGGSGGSDAVEQAQLLQEVEHGPALS